MQTLASLLLPSAYMRRTAIVIVYLILEAKSHENVNTHCMTFCVKNVVEQQINRSQDNLNDSLSTEKCTTQI